MQKMRTCRFSRLCNKSQRHFVGRRWYSILFDLRKDDSETKSKTMSKVKWLIEFRDVTPTMYYAGYEVKDKEECPSGETEAILYKFTEDVYSAKKFSSRRLALDVLANLPSVWSLCDVHEHVFEDEQK